MEENLIERLNNVVEGIPGNFSIPIRARLSFELANAAGKGVDLRKVFGAYGAVPLEDRGVTPGITMPVRNLKGLFYIPTPMINYYTEGEKFARGISLLTGDDANSLGFNIQDNEDYLVKKLLRSNMTPDQQIDAIMQNPSFREDVLEYGKLLLKSSRVNREIAIKITEKRTPERLGLLNSYFLSVKLMEEYARQMNTDLNLPELMERVPEKTKTTYREYYEISFDD